MLRLPERTLEDGCLTHAGPPYLKLGRRVRYDVQDVLASVNDAERLVPRRGGAEQSLSAPATPPQSFASAKLPLPKPRWSIDFDPEGDDDNEYFLRNAVPRSVAREVRIDSHVERFRIVDAGHFENMSGAKSATFQGQYFAAAAGHGVPFTVAWYDENGEEQRASIELPPWGRPGLSNNAGRWVGYC
jgi:hypothetical protein